MKDFLAFCSTVLYSLRHDQNNKSIVTTRDRKLQIAPITQVIFNMDTFRNEAIGILHKDIAVFPKIFQRNI